jgi:cystathionine beta-lyase
VFGLVAFSAAYRDGAPWRDELLGVVAGNVALLRERLPGGIRLVAPEGTYLAWLDFRELGLDVPELARWLPAEAGLALSPGHWFGRQGAGFARMTIAVPAGTIEDAIERLSDAVRRLPTSPRRT